MAFSGGMDLAIFKNLKNMQFSKACDFTYSQQIVSVLKKCFSKLIDFRKKFTTGGNSTFVWSIPVVEVQNREKVDVNPF